MYCTQCGTQMQDSDKFCTQCGHRAGRVNQESAYAPKRLHRSIVDKKLGGVCAGLAEYLDVDVVLVRVLVVTGIIISGGLGLLAYIAAWIIMPLERERVYQASPNTHSSAA